MARKYPGDDVTMAMFPRLAYRQEYRAHMAGRARPCAFNWMEGMPNRTNLHRRVTQSQTETNRDKQRQKERNRDKGTESEKMPDRVARE